MHTVLHDHLRHARTALALLLAILLVPVWQFAAQATTTASGDSTLLPGTAGLSHDVLTQPLRWQVLEAVPGSDATDATIDTAVAATGAPKVWDTTTGADTVVALIDTGVAPIPALEGAIAGEVDFTGTGGGDGYGHGTFMASLLAGGDRRAPGVAPDAGILSLKVADETGATDLGTVLGALEWLAGPGRALGIEVAVLAAGVPADSPGGEVLDLATQRLAHLGVLVVTAAGNDGPGNLTSPATSPGTVSVGALDDRGTSDPADDIDAGFSATGADRVDVAQPDLHAGGVKVVGSMAPDSRIAVANPGAVIDDTLFRGSGTSMATALTGGVAALISDAVPALRGGDLVEALRAGDQLDAEAALAAARQGPAETPPLMLDPAAAKDFADGFDAVATQRAEDMATVERDRVADHAKATERLSDTSARAGGKALERRLEAIDRRATRAEQKVARVADRDLARLERRLLGATVPMPSTDIWTPADWDGKSWVAGSWAADRWQAHDFEPPARDLVGWDSLFAGAYGTSAIHWEPERWGAVQWGADQWDAVQWGAVQWGADQWESLHWGAVQWGADDWKAVQWGAVQWGADDWKAVQWGAVQWGAVHAATSNWNAVQWGAVQWGAEYWDAVQWGAVQWGAVQWGAVQWGAVQWGLAAPTRAG